MKDATILVMVSAWVVSSTVAGAYSKPHSTSTGTGLPRVSTTMISVRKQIIRVTARADLPDLGILYF